MQWHEVMASMTNGSNTLNTDSSKKMDIATNSHLSYTMRRFIQYDFDNDKQFQTDLPKLLQNSQGNGSFDTTNGIDSSNECNLLKAKVTYFDQ
jgi:hypothetical protein